jgi:hypothetical protein
LAAEADFCCCGWEAELVPEDWLVPEKIFHRARVNVRASATMTTWTSNHRFVLLFIVLS